MSTEIRLRAKFLRPTANGAFAYAVSSFSRDAKTATAEMDFFHENYTEQSTSGNRPEGVFYSNDLYPNGVLTFDYNAKTDKSYFNLSPDEDFIYEAALRNFGSRQPRRQARTRDEQATTDDDSQDTEASSDESSPKRKRRDANLD